MFSYPLEELISAEFIVKVTASEAEESAPRFVDGRAQVRTEDAHKVPVSHRVGEGQEVWRVN